MQPLIVKVLTSSIAIMGCVLLANLPLLTLCESNWYHTTVEDIFISFTLFSAFALVLIATTSLVLKNLNKACWASGGILLATFGYGPLASLLVDPPDAPGVALFTMPFSFIELPLFLAFITSIWLMFRQIKKSDNKSARSTSLIISVLALVLASHSFLSLAVKTKHHILEPAELPQLTDIEGAKSVDITKISSPLSIVHILVDGYAPPQTMERVFDTKGSLLSDFLFKENFFVAKKATANYPNTTLSMTSMLNLRYLDDPRWRKLPSFHSYVQQNTVVNFLRSLGYSLQVHPGSIISEFRDAHLHSKYRLNELLASSSGFIQLPILRQLIADYWHSLHRKKIDYTLSELEKASFSHPTYLFAHILSPHPPFVYTQDGSPSALTRPFLLHDGPHYGPRDELYKSQYTEQHAYITSRLISAVKNIKNTCNNNCIIIIHSDHGPAFGQQKDASLSDLAERFSILLAIFLPDNDYTGFSDVTSLVNVYRTIFNKTFNQQMVLAENKQYWSPTLEIILQE
jgi:hypothetical protein